MVYAVDFVIDVMSKMSSTKPVMFQRDGSLFIASEQGFGQVTYGLRTRPLKHEAWQEEVPEILESKDLIVKRIDKGGNTKISLKEKEACYVKPIMFNSDDSTFDLESMIRIAEELQKLPDDGKIRMVSHDTAYHSHKYGYAADGIDVWLDTGRVMKRQRYLELLRQKENKLLNEIESFGRLKNPDDRRHFYHEYGKIEFPNGVIITPYLLVTFPRNGILKGHLGESDAWGRNTRLSGSLNYSTPNYDRKSPFNFYITMNSYAFKGKEAREIENKGQSFISVLTNQLAAVNSGIVESGQDFITKINSIHNKAFEPEIKKFKKDFPNLYHKEQAENRV